MNLSDELGESFKPYGLKTFSADQTEAGEAKDQEIWLFSLYVAGTAPNSLRAIGNLYALARDYLSNRFQVEVINILDEPMRALNDGVLVTPMTVKRYPHPEVKIIGNLDDCARVLAALGLLPDNEP